MWMIPAQASPLATVNAGHSENEVFIWIALPVGSLCVSVAWHWQGLAARTALRGSLASHSRSSSWS